MDMLFFKFFARQYKKRKQVMSTSFIYHALSLKDQDYKRTLYKNGEVIFEVTPKVKSVRCPQCNSRNVVKRGKVIRNFRSLPVGSKKTWVKAHVQRVWCSSCNIIRQVSLSFADTKKSYTKAFARYVLELSSKMTIKDIADHLQTSWDLIKNIQKTELKRKYKKIKLSKLKKIAIDEIAIAKGHKYMTIVMDLESGKIVYADKGKGSDSLTAFFKKLKASRAKIQAVSIDMSPAYIYAVIENLPKADIVFDKFHIVKLFNEKLSELRRKLFNKLESKEDKKIIKGTRWLLLKNPENLKKDSEKKRLESALKINEPLAKAYYMKEELRQIWSQPSKEEASEVIDSWMMLARETKNPLLIKFGNTLMGYKTGILNYYEHSISSGPLEGLNNKIKTMKRQAYGYRDFEFFKLKIFDIHKKKYALIG